MSDELTLQEAALAWAQGKRVEAFHERLLSAAWTIIEEPGKGCFHTYSAGVFGDCAGKYQFRLAPEPPAKKWRPWTPEEVPVGAVMRWKSMPTHASLICSHGDSCVFPAGATHGTPFDDALTNWVYSIDPVGTPDSKRTWLPCGVEVEQ